MCGSSIDRTDDYHGWGGGGCEMSGAVQVGAGVLTTDGLETAIVTNCRQFCHYTHTHTHIHTDNTKHYE